jgi:acyl carrier protein
VDSLDLLELMFKIEDKYGLAINDDVPTTLTTINDVVQYVDGLLERRAKSSGSESADDLHAST